jgi:hypothetical protein
MALRQGVGCRRLPCARFLGASDFVDKVRTAPAMTTRLSIDDEPNQNPARVHGTAEGGGCGVLPESQFGRS